MAGDVERADSTRMVQLGRGVVLLVVGGVLALVALIASIASFTLGTRLEDVEAVLDPWIPPAMKDPRVVGLASPFSSDEGMERLVADAGFSDVRTVLTTVPVRFDDEEQWYRWTWSTGQRRMWAAVPEADRLAVRAAAEERLQATRGSDGRIGFDQVARFTYGRR